MSLSSESPGVLPGWSSVGKRGTRRLKKSARRASKRLARRAGAKLLRKDEA